MTPPILDPIELHNAASNVWSRRSAGRMPSASCSNMRQARTTTPSNESRSSQNGTPRLWCAKPRSRGRRSACRAGP